MTTIKLEKPFQKLGVVVIGAAGKKGNEYLNALMKRNDIEISAVVINKKTLPIIDDLEKRGTKVIRNGDIESLIASVSFDIAVISVPHSEHDLITKTLLQAGKYIIKEKPLAITMAQAEHYYSLITDKNIPPMYTTVQRSIMPSFVNSKTDVSLIGNPLKFDYSYCFNLPTVTTGWRAKKESAGGGVILDMGYHAIDVLTNFFGTPDSLSSLIDYKYQETAQEDVEDSAEIVMEYSSGLKGKLILDRHAHDKKETFNIYGTHGSMSITPQGYQIFNLVGELIKNVTYPISKEEEIVGMFKQAIPYHQNSDSIDNAFLRNMENVKIIEQIYSCKQLKPKAMKEPASTHLVNFSVFSKGYSEQTTAMIANDHSINPLTTQNFNMS